MEIIDKSYFVVIWIALSLLFFWLYLHYTDNNEKNNLTNGAGYMFSSISILGGIRILLNHFVNDFTLETNFTLDTFYNYYGGIMVIWVSIVGIKSKLAKD